MVPVHSNGSKFNVGEDGIPTLLCEEPGNANKFAGCVDLILAQTSSFDGGARKDIVGFHPYVGEYVAPEKLHSLENVKKLGVPFPRFIEIFFGEKRATVIEKTNISEYLPFFSRLSCEPQKLVVFCHMVLNKFIPYLQDQPELCRELHEMKGLLEQFYPIGDIVKTDYEQLTQLSGGVALAFARQKYQEAMRDYSEVLFYLYGPSVEINDELIPVCAFWKNILDQLNVQIFTSKKIKN